VAINCAAVPQTLLESEPFGYAPAAFTGASARGPEGKVAAAHRGTLFLDEIGDVQVALQALLLRFLDDGTYYRVGDSQPRAHRVRHLPRLAARVRAGDFRQDLFYRIEGACVSPPPARDRGDRVWLAEQMLAADGGKWGLTVSAQEYIESHSWPGNMRELKSTLLHARADAGRPDRQHALRGPPARRGHHSAQRRARQPGERAPTRARAV
jgi:transcriptional regulator with PAS, ATPase and Fis domain